MFVCTLAPGLPVEVDRLDAENEYIARIPIGYMAGTNLVYSALVALSPIPGYPPDCLELTFCVIEARTDQTHFEEFWDGAMTKEIITSPAERALILDVVTQAAGALIDVAQPSEVHITTHSPYLPVNALAKYDAVLEMMRGMGFQIEEAEPYHGRRLWMCSRLDTNA